MRLRVENFGPISRAEIEIKPLTVLIGKNGSGKSMLAQLIYTLMDLRNHLPYLMSPITVSSQKIGEISKRIKSASAEEMTPHSFVKMIGDVIIGCLTPYLSEALRRLLERNFAMELKSLVNLYSDHVRVKCFYSKHSVLEFTISKDGDLSTKFNVEMVDELINEVLTDERVKRFVDIALHSKEERDFVDAVIVMERRILEHALPKRPISSAFYIPAGRAGLLEGYEAVSSALIALAPTAPLRGIFMPPLPGMASEFYSLLLRLKGKRGSFSEVAELFKDLIEGDIVFEELEVPKGKSKMVYRFKFKDKESSIDLIHAASMVKELSPIYLVLRELVDEGDLLIIEEPESHLHPAAQIRLMEIFARLVNEGLRILITTHSDIVLRELSHLVMEGLTGSKTEASLKPDDVVVYLLKPDEKGYVAREVNILEEMPTFDEVMEQLYEKEKDLRFSLSLLKESE
jgi:predicted ATPase